MAWRCERNHSALAVVQWAEGRGATLTGVHRGLYGLQNLTDAILAESTANTVIAIDAPLRITNASGRRACEAEVSALYRRHHAGAHATNLALYPDADSVRLAEALGHEGYGFATPDLVGGAPGRWMFETFPHPASVVLFGLGRIVRYKRGSAAERAAGLTEWRDVLRRLPMLDPPLASSPLLAEILDIEPTGLRGAARKHHEDLLDALLCGYLAFHAWHWGARRNVLHGSMAEGAILLPAYPYK